MTACSSPPNKAPREVIDRLIDAVAWAKTCMLIAEDVSDERSIVPSRLA